LSTVHSTRPASSGAYQKVFEASPDYITISRLSDARYIDVNPGFERLMGYRVEEIVGRTSLELGVWAQPEARQHYVDAIKAGSNRPFLCELVSRDGRHIPMEATGSIAVIDGEEVLIAVMRDVTERVLKDRELARYQESLETLVAERTTELQQAQHRLQAALDELRQAHMRAVESERRSRFEAEHDRLTGLPNRATLEQKLFEGITLAQRTRHLYAVLFVDLDNFKPINDTFGHRVGDEVLKAVAGRLQSATRNGDTVARLGGDEFVIGVSGLLDRAAAAAVARKVLRVLDEPVVVNGQVCHVGASIGIALYPDDGAGPPALIQAADTAMYQAKQAGRGNFRFRSELAG